MTKASAIKKAGPKKTKVGRPRQFDADKALEKALHVFWEKGYQGTSMPDLTKAMGINRPSIYAAFGNKESLFFAALDRYSEKSREFAKSHMDAPTARAAIEGFLFAAVEISTQPGRPRGCLLVQGALACGDEAECIRKELTARRGQFEILLRRRFEQGKKDGDLPKSADASALAKFFATFVQGMAVQNAGGATRKELETTVETALRVWPR